MTREYFEFCLDAGREGAEIVYFSLKRKEGYVWEGKEKGE
jgi:hypothetical protein